MMTYNITIYKGADFRGEISLSDNDGNIINLTNYTNPRATLRTYFQSTQHTDFDVTIEGNLIKWSMSHTVTRQLKSGKHVYDVFVTNDYNEVVKIMGGIADVKASATQPV